MQKLQALFVAVMFTLLPIFVVAAEDPEMAGTGWDIATTIYMLAGGLLLGLVTWLGAKLGKWLNTKHSNEWWAGTLARFNTALMDGLKAAHTKLKKGIEEAKDPNSPGGSRITKAEMEQIKAEVWDFLKDRYGGMSGLTSALGVFVGGNVENWVSSKIDAAMGDLEREEKAAGNPT